MITTVTPSHTIPIPEDISRQFGIQPGWRLDWSPIEGRDEILVRVIPGRGELAGRLLGAGQRFSPERDSIAELIAYCGLWDHTTYSTSMHTVWLGSPRPSAPMAKTRYNRTSPSVSGSRTLVESEVTAKVQGVTAPQGTLARSTA